MHNRYSGRCGCGCGGVQVILFSQLRPGDFEPRSDAATCQFCVLHDGKWISDPNGHLEICAGSRTAVVRNGSGNVQFHFCTDCRQLAYAIYHDEVNEKSVGVVRVALFADVAAGALPVKATNFDAESVVEARNRRLRNWTPVSGEGRGGS
jgi:hypothetical protein